MAAWLAASPRQSPASQARDMYHSAAAALHGKACIVETRASVGQRITGSATITYIHRRTSLRRQRRSWSCAHSCCPHTTCTRRFEGKAANVGKAGLGTRYLPRDVSHSTTWSMLI